MGERGILFLILQDSPLLLQFFSSSEDCFSWLKLTSFCLPFFFYLFWLIMVHHPSFASFALFPSGLSLCFCFFSPLNQIYDSVKCGGVLQIWHR